MAGGGEGHWLVAALQHPGLVVLLPAVVESEQVDLVVAGLLLPLGPEHQAGVAHLVRPPWDGHGQRAPHDPQAVLAGGVRQELLDGPLARHFGQGQLVGVAPAQQAEILGQCSQRRTCVSRLGNQAPCRLQVAPEVGGGHHLQGGDLHGGGQEAATTEAHCRRQRRRKGPRDREPGNPKAPGPAQPREAGTLFQEQGASRNALKTPQRPDRTPKKAGRLCRGRTFEHARAGPRRNHDSGAHQAGRGNR